MKLLQKSNLRNSEEIEKFEQYAKTHPEIGDVPTFEQNFFQPYLSDFKGRILDIGCGEGKYICYFASVCQASIFGCDISFRRFQQTITDQYQGAVASAESLPFQADSFDAVFMMQVIEHLSHYEHAIQESQRVLKKNGYLFITTPNYPIKRVYDWARFIRFGQWKKLFDDPTHCARFSAYKLKEVLDRYFQEVEIYPTFILGEGKIRAIKDWRERRKSSLFLSHKLVAVCRVL